MFIRLSVILLAVSHLSLALPAAPVVPPQAVGKKLPAGLPIRHRDTEASTNMVPQVIGGDNFATVEQNQNRKGGADIQQLINGNRLPFPLTNGGGRGNQGANRGSTPGGDITGTGNIEGQRTGQEINTNGASNRIERTGQGINTNGAPNRNERTGQESILNGAPEGNAGGAVRLGNNGGNGNERVGDVAGKVASNGQEQRTGQVNGRIRNSNNRNGGQRGNNGNKGSGSNRGQSNGQVNGENEGLTTLFAELPENSPPVKCVM